MAGSGGHSPGHQIVYADLNDGAAIITGDIVYRREPGFTEQLPSGYFTSLGKVTDALARIKRDAKHVLRMPDPDVYNLAGREQLSAANRPHLDTR